MRTKLIIYEIYFLVAHFPRWFFIEWKNDGDLIYLHRLRKKFMSLSYIYFLVAHLPRWFFIEWENDGDLIYLHRGRTRFMSLSSRYIFLWHIGWEQDICLSLRYISLWHIFRNSGNSVGKCIACNVWWDAWTLVRSTSSQTARDARQSSQDF